AAIREVREEVGVSLRPEDLQVVGTMHRQSDDERVDFFLAVQTWSGELSNCEPDKCSELRWFPMDALPPDTIPYVRKGIENYLKGVWFEEFGWG
ncbi:MAG: NUDIX domain-containing protein, partial [Anaerolineales bacterium]|nr:NUDIX domain-containing protein [Anaerolineales bacterium]